MRTILFLLLATMVVMGGVSFAAAPSGEEMTVVFSTNEDYDTSEYASAEGLKRVEKDFQAALELGVDMFRVSFSWSNYEPMQDSFANLEWLHQFVDLADKYGITLTPYFCYAPSWATKHGQWNDPPKDYQWWYDYVYRMVSEFKDQIDYWEIWNEEDLDMWFSGGIVEYSKLLKTGAQAVKDADPDATILMGGLTWPDSSFVEYMLDKGLSEYFDVVPIHSYMESWNSSAVESYLKPWGTDFDYIAQLLEEKGDGQPIWLNEIGYPTNRDRTEEDQANFIRRAVATLMSTGHISLISWYEIKDLPQDFHLGVIGDDNNYHLGLAYPDGTKKLGFYTYQNIVHLLNREPVVYQGDLISFEEYEPGSQQQRLYTHGFLRKSDGKLILFAWLYGPKKQTTIKVQLPSSIDKVVEYRLDGSSYDYTDFTGNLIENLHLEQDKARVFEISFK